MAVRESLLALLRQGPNGGYQLKIGFEAATGGIWRLNVGQVYTTLDRLARDGAVEADEQDGNRSYRITDDGMAELGAWWETTPADEPPQRDELMLKVLLASLQGKEHAQEVIDVQRAAVTSLLQDHTRRMRAAAKRSPSLQQRLVADALIMRAEADLRWLDRCEQRLLDEAE